MTDPDWGITLLAASTALVMMVWAWRRIMREPPLTDAERAGWEIEIEKSYGLYDVEVRRRERGYQYRFGFAFTYNGAIRKAYRLIRRAERRTVMYR